MADAWTKAQTISTFISLGAILIAAFALVVDRIRLVHKRDEHLKATDRIKMSYFYTERLGWWQTLIGTQSPALRVVRVSSLIEAGDRGLWTSTALDRIPEGHSEISWVPLFASIFEEIAYFETLGRDEKHTTIRDGVLTQPNQYTIVRDRILAKSNEQKISHKLRRWKHYEDGKLVRGCRPLDPEIVDETVPRTAVVHDIETADLHHKGLGITYPTWIMDRKPYLETTREELIALALIMGSSIKIHNYTESLNGVGAFGLSLYAMHSGSHWSLGLTQGSRIPRHMPTMGSGYTTLMAKHLACGNVPFAQNDGWVKSIYLKKPILKAILEGRNIKDISAYGGQLLELLRTLPGEKEIDAYYGVAEDKDKTSPLGVGLILRPPLKGSSRWQIVSDWPKAVTNIAFGGLVPQVFPNIATAVKFTAWGSSEEENSVIEELERLVDRLHERQHYPTLTRHNTDANAKPPEEKICDRCLFGEHVRERYEARKLVDYVNYTVPWQHSKPRAAAAVFARYSNLLEHIATLCDVTSRSRTNSRSATPHDSTLESVTIEPNEGSNVAPALQPTVKSATSYPLDNISSNGLPVKVKTHRTYPSSDTHIQTFQPTSMERLFDKTYDIIRSVYAARFGRQVSLKEEIPADLIYTQDLGKTLAHILDTKLPEGPTPKFPLTLSEGAFIVRCILAAWSWQVPYINLIDPTTEDDVDNVKEKIEESLGKEGSRIASIDELPPVLAFG